MFPWFDFLTYAVITAITPGPNNLMSMSQAGQWGFKKTFPFNLGIWFGFTLVMILCTLLSVFLHQILPTIQTPMRIIGAGYLCYLAWKTWNSASSAKDQAPRVGFFSGCFLQFVNPKIYIYALLSMEVYILPYYAGQTVLLFLFAALLAFIGFLFTVVWAIFGSFFQRLFSQHGKITNRILALLLMECAVSLFL